MRWNCSGMGVPFSALAFVQAAASAALDKAIALDPKVPDAWSTRSMIENRRQGEYAQAEKGLLKGLELQESSA